jgi:hypothetical protein
MQKLSGFRKQIKRFAAVVALVCLFAAAAQNAQAQFETASVLGYVRDSSGNVIAGGSVQLINTATGVVVKVTTDSQGQYQFTDVTSVSTRSMPDTPGSLKPRRIPLL